MKVKELPLDDRPREKLILKGSSALSDSELLAILLRTGSKGKSVVQLAKEIISQFGSLSDVALKSASALAKINGIGKDKAATLIAAFEIGKRIDFNDRLLLKKKITSPDEVAEMFIPLLRDEIKERFIVVCLNSSNKILKYETISIGSLNSSVVHPREVFKAAIDNNSANIILIHNHPSGNCEPSSDDVKITKQLIEAGKILGIEVFDHIIVAGNQYLSFVNKKLI